MKSSLFSLLISIILILFSVLPVRAQGQYPEYVVQPGDTLTGIAELFGITVDELINLNSSIDPNFLGVGDRLSIPGLEGISGTFTRRIVEIGETLDSLTVKYQMEKDLLVRLNKLTSPGEVYAGRTLLLLYSDDTNSRVSVGKSDSSNTLIEISARSNTSTWVLLGQNNRNRQTNLLPSQLIYAMSTTTPNQVSIIDPRLSEVSISPLPLVQGKTFTITVKSEQPVTLQGSLDGNPLVFFAVDENQQVALQGINAMAETGLSTFSLSGKFSDGGAFSTEQLVLLESGGYSTADPLTVDPSLIDPTVIGPEEELIAGYTSMITPTKYWSGVFTRPGFYDEYNALFGERRNYNDGAYSSFHTGLDFAGGEDLPIAAAADGIVVYTGELQVRGNATIIDHGWGVFTAYYHQSEVAVQVGDQVTAGQIIGKVGHTGRVDDSLGFENAGAHLHWEVWVNGVQVDPLEWLEFSYP
jgi:murein DD-endopeptidase MepM/ murein hydrolase activator NlpD